MGTNYYLKSTPCETCGHCQNEIHIGKGSMGWKFLFDSNYGETHSYDIWLEDINDPKRVIFNEYNEVVDKKEFLEMIEEKQNLKPHRNTHDFFSYFEDEKGYDFSKTSFR